LASESDRQAHRYAYSRIFKIRYSLRSNYENADESVKKWEIAFIKFMKTLETNKTQFTFATSQSLELELMENVGFDSLLISITFIIITTLAVCLMSLKTNWITSPGLLLPVRALFLPS
jgi:hypothetical protein